MTITCLTTHPGERDGLVKALLQALYTGIMQDDPLSLSEARRLDRQLSRQAKLYAVPSPQTTPARD